MNAIKVGFGDNPYQRMLSYSQKYELIPQKKSLKMWEMPSSGIASNIEKSCHEVLVISGFERIKISSEDSAANEIFDLNDFNYQDAVTLIVQEIDSHLSYLRKSLAGLNFSEENERINKKTEIKQKREANKEKQIEELVYILQEGYEKNYRGFLDAKDRQRNYFQGFNFKENSFFENIFQKQKTYSEQLGEWSGFEKSVDFVEPVLKTSRVAREFYHWIHSKFKNEIVQEAQKRLNIDLWHPASNNYEYNLPVPRVLNRLIKSEEITKAYGETIDIAVFEVAKCIWACPGNHWTYCKKNEKLQALIKWARKNPPPEIFYGE